MTPLTFVRLYDAFSVNVTEARVWDIGNTTTFQAGDTCRIARDELGWVHIHVGRMVDGNVAWRPKEFLAPPHAVKWAECEPNEDGAARGFEDQRALQRATGTDPTFLHPKAKRR